MQFIAIPIKTWSRYTCKWTQMDGQLRIRIHGPCLLIKCVQTIVLQFVDAFDDKVGEPVGSNYDASGERRPYSPSAGL